jgi:uncharacterized tellurite resistance protein B-like protein
MNLHERGVNGNKLKAAFNLLWDETMKKNDQILSYRDMTRIADAIRLEGPGILNLEKLPKNIDASLNFAISVVDPNKNRSKENLKKGLAGLTGASGLTLVVICLGNLLNPGLLAIVVTTVTGGIAGGPLAVIGVGVGLLMVATAIFNAFQKMTPKERAVKAHEFVTKGIDCWIEKGEKEITIEKEPSKAISSDFSEDELDSVYSILNHVSSIDGKIDDRELKIIKDALGITARKIKYSFDEAINLVKNLNQKKRKELVSWCFGIAYADNFLHPKENDLLKIICSKLDVDFYSFLKLLNN